MTINDFETQFLPLGSRLYRRALSITGNAEDAGDAVQETYALLWHRREELQGMERAEGYFAQTLRNCCLKLLRSRRAVLPIEAAETLPSEGGTPDGDVEAAEQRTLLRRIIREELKPKAARMVLLSAFGQMEPQEIARATGETVANVRVILHRSRRIIAGRLKQLNSI